MKNSTNINNRVLHTMLTFLKDKFEGAGFDYDELTENEKSLLTEDEFYAIRSLINNEFKL
jgi:hypothetical protein